MKAKPAERPEQARCAIYTRKSSEEGLDQAFNSLHAQREACEAYVRSQAGEGWTVLPTTYDDGGFSGGNVERPALQRLIADITAGRVDTVVVYKIDRLTRSLADFAKIVDVFDTRDVSFVSVTQAFNTTTSMGRLTLNVLLSFAQFEREVTGERIRDKIAQSKAKGMWMGGMIPLGYDVHERTLRINEAEAQKVRHIYRRYLDLGSVNLLQSDLAQSGVRSKVWTTRDGRAMGGAVISRGALFHLLANRLYLGEIQHGQIVHPGLHPAIIDRDLFDAVRERLAANNVVASPRKIRAAPPMLRALVFDAAGEPMSPSFAYGKGGRPYRYYVSQSLKQGSAALDAETIRRVAADGLEDFLLKLLRRLAGKPELALTDLPRCIARVELGRDETHVVLKANALFGTQHRRDDFLGLEARLLASERVIWEESEHAHARVILPARMQFRGGRTWLSDGAQTVTAVRVNPGIVQALRSSHAELMDLNASPLTAPEGLGQAKAPSGLHRRQLSRLPFLAPDLQRAILEGRQPAQLKLRTLLKSELPLLWSDQREWFAAMRLATIRN